MITPFGISEFGVPVYVGLTTDTKPVTGVENGTVILEIDSGDVFFFDQENAQWVKQ